MLGCDSGLQESDVLFIPRKGPKCKESVSGKKTDTRDNLLMIKKVVRNINLHHTSYYSTTSTVLLSVTKASIKKIYRIK